ncbi:MAG: 1,6-anhydro-N-acetylmuramyl-L-alanine amidase AmpD [Gammaproteobacteria bacterium]
MNVHFEEGWLCGVRRCPSPNCDARPPGATLDLVVIHAISLPPGEFGTGSVEALFTNTLDCRAHPYFAALEALHVSAHFLIARDGALTQFVPVDQRAWHAGQSCWAGRTACNDFSIGIELEGCDDVPFTDAQYESLDLLLGALRSELPGLDASRVVGHSDIAPGRKTDPGPCFEWGRVRAALVP